MLLRPRKMVAFLYPSLPIAVNSIYAIYPKAGVDVVRREGASANGGSIMPGIFSASRLWRDRGGATAAEYALLLAIIGGGMVGATWLLGQAVGSQMNQQVALFASSAGSSSTSSSSSSSGGSSAGSGSSTGGSSSTGGGGTTTTSTGGTTTGGTSSGNGSSGNGSSGNGSSGNGSSGNGSSGNGNGKK